MKPYIIQIKGPKGNLFCIEVLATDIQDLGEKMLPMYNWVVFEVVRGVWLEV